MVYICPDCWKGYTLPVGDYMREKKIPCVCKESSSKFLVGETWETSGKLVDTLYEVLS